LPRIYSLSFVTEKIDIYHKDKELDATVRRIERSDISPRNKELIFAFQRQCFADGLGSHRIYQYLNTIPHFAKWIDKDLDKATKDDIINLVQKFEKMDYSDWTKMGFKTALKKFYKWLRDDRDPPEVKWIKTTKRNLGHTLPDDLITESEVRQLIDTVSHPRDKAIISMLYESGCRIGEVLSLRIRNAVFDEYGTVLTVTGKTGSRRVRIISATPYLAAWINSHPDSKNPEAPLWVGIGTRKRNKHIDYPAVRILITRAAKRAGIKKKIYPHLFRHSRATFLATRLTEAQMNEYFGWAQGSSMPSTYVHLSGRDVDDALLKMHGLVKDDTKQEAPLKPKDCERCEERNPATSKFCNRCGAPLDIETAIALDDEMSGLDEKLSLLLEDPAVQEVMIKRMRETGITSQ